MPYPSTTKKERLSIAYISAVAAKAGIKFIETGSTDFGVDVYLQLITQLSGGDYIEDGVPLQFQVKSTSNFRIEGEFVSYAMKAKAYNKLIAMQNYPCLLLLYLLPIQESEWLLNDEGLLTLKQCCYWHHLTGEPTYNSSSITIKIPRPQLFTPQTAIDLIKKARLGHFNNDR